MRRITKAVLVLCSVLIGSYQVQADDLGLLGTGQTNSFGWVLTSAAQDCWFEANMYYNCATGSNFAVTRSDGCTPCATDLMYWDAAGASYDTFASNTLRIRKGMGLLVEAGATNQLHNSTAPATQTTASLGNGTYVLWVNGSGSAAVTNGTGTGCSGTATQGAPDVFTTSGSAGTCVVTVTGSLNEFQLELGSWPTSLIVTGGGTGQRAAENVHLAGTAATNLALSSMSFLIQTNGLNQNGTTSTTVRMFSGTTNTAWLSALGSTSNWTTYQSNTNSVAVTATAGYGGWMMDKYRALSNPSGLHAAIAYGTNGSTRYVVAGNGTVQSDSNPPTTNTTYYLGSQTGSSSFVNGFISRFAIWSSQLASGAMAPLTANLQEMQNGQGYVSYTNTSSSQGAGQNTFYVDIGQNLEYEYTQAWTFMASFTQTKATPGSTTTILFSNVNTSPHFPGYECWINSANKLNVRIINTFDGAAKYIDVSGSTVLADGRPHEVACTYSGSGTAAGVGLYIDGVAETLTTNKDSLGASTIVSAPQHMSFGNQVNHNTGTGSTGSFGLYGSMQNIRMYNVVKSSGYISTYTPGSPPPCDSDAVLCLNLNDASGSTAKDNSSNAFNGSAVGGSFLWTPPAQ
jgi:hypothetical protein